MEVQDIRLNYLIPSKNLRTEQMPDVTELANSIKEIGLLQPIRVRHLHGESYQIIAGHRRAQAHRILGLKHISAVVVKESDQTAAVQSIVENLQREDLTPLELARGVQELSKDFDLDADGISKMISKSLVRVRTWLKFSTLPDDVLDQLESGEGRTQKVTGLTPRHIEPFIRDMPSEVAAQLDDAAAEKYEQRLSSVRELQKEVKERSVHINAHMADAIAKETRHGVMTVSEAMDKVLSEPERYRYRAPATMRSPSQLTQDPNKTLPEKDKLSETNPLYAPSIFQEINLLSKLLDPANIPNFNDKEKYELTDTIDNLQNKLGLYKDALLQYSEPSQNKK